MEEARLTGQGQLRIQGDLLRLGMMRDTQSAEASLPVTGMYSLCRTTGEESAHLSHEGALRCNWEALGILSFYFESGHSLGSGPASTFVVPATSSTERQRPGIDLPTLPTGRHFCSSLVSRVSYSDDTLCLGLQPAYPFFLFCTA